MQDLSTVKQAHVIIHEHHKELVLLHCVSSYPTAPADVNLNILDLYKKEFPNTVIGYSGHEKGINIAIAAVARGAKVVLVTIGIGTVLYAYSAMLTDFNTIVMLRAWVHGCTIDFPYG